MFPRSILSVPKWGAQAAVKGGTAPRTDGTVAYSNFKSIKALL